MPRSDGRNKPSDPFPPPADDANGRGRRAGAPARPVGAARPHGLDGVLHAFLKEKAAAPPAARRPAEPPAPSAEDVEFEQAWRTGVGEAARGAEAGPPAAEQQGGAAVPDFIDLIEAVEPPPAEPAGSAAQGFATFPFAGAGPAAPAEAAPESPIQPPLASGRLSDLPPIDDFLAPAPAESAAFEESAAPAFEESAAPALEDTSQDLDAAVPPPSAAPVVDEAPDEPPAAAEAPATVIEDGPARRISSIPPAAEALDEPPLEPPAAESAVEPPPVALAEPSAPKVPVEPPPAPPPRRRTVPPAPPPKAGPPTPMTDHDAYRRETQRLARTREWQKFADLTAAVVEGASWADLPETRATLLGDLARIYRDRLKDPAEAEAAYRRLAGADPANADALEFLAARYREREEWRELHDLYAAAVDATWDPDQRLELTRETATLANERLRSTDLAIAAWERLWRLGDAGEETVQALQDVYRRARRWDRLGEFLSEQAAERSGADQVVAWREVAEAYLSGLRDHEKAATVLERILAGRPDDVIALLGMGRVLARRKDWAALAALGARPLDGVQPGAILDFRRLVADALWTAGEHERSVAIHELILATDPEDPDALRAKEEHFSSSGKVDALVAFLAARAEAVADVPRRAELLARAAKLAAEQLDDLPRAVALWQRRAELDTDRLETFRALAALHEKLGEPEGVARAIEGQLALTRRPTLRIELLRRLGEHYAHRLADDTKAEACWKEILSFVPDDAATRDELVALLRRRGDFEALDRVLAAQAARATDDATALAFWRDAALNVEQNVYDPARAVRAWWRVLDLTPDDGEVLHRFVDHHRNVGRPREWIAAQEAELSGLTDADERVRRALDLAALWEKENRPAAALAVHERILRWAPADGAALAAVARLRGAEEAGAAIGACDVAAASLPPDATAARIALLRQALALLDPADKLGRFFGLRRILWLSGCDAGCLAELERAAEEAGAWRELIAVYLVLAADATDGAARGAAQQRLARLYEEREHDAVRAFLVLQAAGLAAPEDPRALEQLARLAETTGRHEDLLALLDVAARAGRPADERHVALCRRASICETRLGDTERAFHEWARVLADDPRDTEALDNARRLAAAKGLWRQLDALYAELGDRAAGDAERVALALARHQIRAERLDDPRGALDQLLVAYRLDPAPAGLFDRIVEAAERLGAWSRVLPVLEARVRALGRGAAPEELARCAELTEQKREDREQALELYTEAFVLQPGAADLRAHLERLAAATGRLDLLAFAYRLAAARSADREQQLDFYHRLTELYAGPLARPGEALDVHQRIVQIRPSAIASLEVVLDHHRAAGNARELRDRLGQWLEHAPADSAGRVARWLEIARLSREPLADPESALTAYARVLELEPANDEAAQGVRSLTEGPIEPSLELRRLRLELVRATGERRSEIRLACARIQEEQLDDAPAALATLRELVDEAGPAGPGFAPLTRLLRERGEWPELVDRIEARAAALTDAGPRLEALEQAIAICEEHPEAGPPERRERLYRRVIDERPDDAGTRRRLLALYREAGRWEDLLTLLRATRDVLPRDAEGDAERRALDDEIVRVLDRSLGRTAEAETLLAERGKREPQDLDAALWLAGLKLRRGDFGGWLLLRQQQARKLPPARAALAFCHLAEACDETPGQQTKSAAYYREARTLDGGCVPATKALQAIGRRAKNWRAAAALLPQDDEATLPWAERAVRLTALGDGAAATDAAAAVQWYRRAVAVDPDAFPAWDALARLHAGRGDHTLALAAERNALAAFERATAPDPARLREHAERIQRVAAALAVTGGEEEAARLSLRAWRLVPSHGSAALAVAEQRLAAQDDDAAFAILDRVLRDRTHPLSDSERLQATFRRGALLARRGRREEAVADLREGLRIDALHSGLLNALADVLADQGRVAAAVQHYVQSLLVAHEAPRRGALYARLGRLWDDRLGSADEAGACYDLAIGAGADDHDLLVRALRHYRRTGLSDRAIAVIERLLPATNDAKELAGLWTERGGALSAVDEDKAMEAYDMALSYDPGHQPALAGLAAILERRGDWDQLLQIYEARADSGTPQERAHALRNLASIALARLDDKARAERYLRTAIELAPERADFEKLLEVLGADPAKQEAWQAAVAGLVATPGPRLRWVVELAKALAAAGRRRQAWCIASPLAHISAVETPLKTLLAELRREFEKAENTAVLTPQTHLQVRHPDVLPALFDVLAELDDAVPLGPATPQEAGAAGAAHLDVRTPLGKAFAALAERLGIADAALMRAADLPVPLRPLDVPPAHVLMRSDLFQLLQPAETNFLLVTGLELARPGAKLIASLEPDRLRDVVGGLFAAGGLVPETPETAPLAARLREAAGERLGGWAERLRDLAPAIAAGEPLAVRLRDGVMETARRVGLVAAGEVRFVARMMTRLDPGLPKLQMSGKVAELEDFFSAAPSVLALLACACTPEFGATLG